MQFEVFKVIDSESKQKQIHKEITAKHIMQQNEIPWNKEKTKSGRKYA